MSISATQAISDRFNVLSSTLKSTSMLASDGLRYYGRLPLDVTRTTAEDIEVARSVLAELRLEVAQASRSSRAWNNTRLEVDLLARALDVVYDYLTAHIESIRHFGFQCHNIGGHLDDMIENWPAALAVARVADNIVSRMISLDSAIEASAGNTPILAINVDVALSEEWTPPRLTSSDASADDVYPAASLPLPESMSATSRLLTALAIQVLPGDSRTRYQEEFLAELFELHTKSRRTQISHSARLLLRSAGLRRSLR